MASGAAEKISDLSARPAPEWLTKSVICQVPLRSFTQEGTLAAATERLGHLADAGIGCVYLLPIAEADPDQNREFWSPRQRKSNINNPCNPYRIKNYFKIDSEYGTDADLKKFVDRAHELGMKVILDLVYYHCGPTADIITANPDFVVRDENGKVKKGEYHFPELDFKNPKLRSYLISNMEYFISEFGVDGYRADAESLIPIDFWETAREKIEKIKPDAILIAESPRPECQLKAYDANYGFGVSVDMKDFFAGSKDAKVKTAKELGKKFAENLARYPKGARVMYHYDNHDISSYDGRPEAEMPYEAADAMTVFLLALDGVPMLFAGNEIADRADFHALANRYHKRSVLDWSAAFTDAGKRRLEIVKAMSKIRRERPEFFSGEMKWIDSGNDKVLAFERAIEISTKLSENPKAYFAQRAKVSGGGDSAKVSLEPYGFALIE
ncbi:MAG: hypothetical protein BHW65_02395 [Verrucomicrobia bacterium CAG:312_58_20]|nr:MAG: hypothetical protein BHW65_02395 [Verrucomicrobia bacterium CAG:312_58_20]